MRLLLILLLAISMSVPAFGQEIAEDWVKKGDELRDQFKYEEAIQAYDKALEIDPQCAEASSNKVFVLRYERKTRPETGTCVKDIARNGHGELIIINGNRTHDVLASLIRPNNETLVSVFIRAGESSSISEIDDGEYNMTFSFGKALDRGSKRFIEEGGCYRLDWPIIFETASEPVESTRDKKMTGWETWTFWYTSWTITLNESGPASNGKETKVEEREVQYRKYYPDMPLPGASETIIFGRIEASPRDDPPVPLENAQMALNGMRK